MKIPSAEGVNRHNDHLSSFLLLHPRPLELHASNPQGATGHSTRPGPHSARARTSSALSLTDVQLPPPTSLATQQLSRLPYRLCLRARKTNPALQDPCGQPQLRVGGNEATNCQRVPLGKRGPRSPHPPAVTEAGKAGGSKPGRVHPERKCPSDGQNTRVVFQ
ncbi:uncharacterized protein LOC144376929 [Ictidomys tridecemlineatus]